MGPQGVSPGPAQPQGGATFCTRMQPGSQPLRGRQINATESHGPGERGDTRH